jgi:YVTN family beta-propeller protein
MGGDEGAGQGKGGAGAEIRTFLIADVRGYTLFTQERGDEAAAKLAARFADVSREVVEARGGSLLELRGDEALIAFDSARQAIRTAIDLQRRFVEETEADSRLPLPVGIGLDAGEAVPVGTGFRGGALNLAARLCGLADPGKSLASRTVISLAGKLDGVRYMDRGDVHLKGVEEPVQVIEVIDERGDVAERLASFVAVPSRRVTRKPTRRKRVVIAALIALALIAAISVPLILSDPGSPPITRDAVAVVDLESGDVTGSVPLEARPGTLAVGEEDVWVTQPDRGEVVRIDPNASRVVDTVPVGADPAGIAVGGGAVWVTDAGSSTQTRISPDTNQIVQSIDVGGGPQGVAFGHGSIWVATSTDDAVAQVDAGTGMLVATIDVGDRPVAVTASERTIWVANFGSGTVSRIDPFAGREVTTVPVGHGPSALAVGSGGVWVGNQLDDTVSRIAVATNAVDRTVRVGDGPVGVEIGGGSVWASNELDGTISQIDLHSGDVTSIQVGSATRSAGVVQGGLWVGVRGPTDNHRGGTLRIVSEHPVGTIDPAVGYDPAAWSISPLVYDGLVGFKRTGGVDGTILVPDLAVALPTPTDHGTTYTFQVRPDVSYSSGAVVRPSDFRRAIERLYLLETDGTFFFQGLAGADRCSPDGCDLSAGVETNDVAGTVTFHLTESDPDFLYKLALPFASAVPEGTPGQEAVERPIPGTGPYQITHYDRSAELTLGRNPEFEEWSTAAQPDGFPDRIQLRSGVPLDEQIALIEEGAADLMLEEPPPAQSVDLSARLPTQLHVQPRLFTVLLVLNNTVPPFSDLRARQALNLVVDRNRIVGLLADAARSTCQILPPNMPGYDPYCPYTADPGPVWSGPDLAAASELVASSDTVGVPVTVWAWTDLGGPGIGERIARITAEALQGLGYKTNVRTMDNANRYFARINDPQNGIQVSLNGWVSDYPAESSFLSALLSCGSPYNGSGFCDEGIENRMREAAALQSTDPAEARDLWAEIEHEAIDQAPVAPLVNPYGVSFVSERVGNYQFNPQWGPLLSQLWVR